VRVESWGKCRGGCDRGCARSVWKTDLPVPPTWVSGGAADRSSRIRRARETSVWGLRSWRAEIEVGFQPTILGAHVPGVALGLTASLPPGYDEYGLRPRRFERTLRHLFWVAGAARVQKEAQRTRRATKMGSNYVGVALLPVWENGGTGLCQSSGRIIHEVRREGP